MFAWFVLSFAHLKFFFRMSIHCIASDIRIGAPSISLFISIQNSAGWTVNSSEGCILHVSGADDMFCTNYMSAILILLIRCLLY